MEEQGWIHWRHIRGDESYISLQSMQTRPKTSLRDAKKLVSRLEDLTREKGESTLRTTVHQQRVLGDKGEEIMNWLGWNLRGYYPEPMYEKSLE